MSKQRVIRFVSKMTGVGQASLQGYTMEELQGFASLLVALKGA